MRFFLKKSMRTGKNLTFYEIVFAIHHVYNFSYALAIFLTLVGFITSGRLSIRRSLPGTTSWWNLGRSIFAILTYFLPVWTLDLSALSTRGWCKITHDAAFVHPDGVSSTAPDPRLLQDFVDYASGSKKQDSFGERFGLNFVDIARYHALRENASKTRLGIIHKQVALGECALSWLVLCGPSSSENSSGEFEGVLPRERLEQWFGEERLPDGWWDAQGVRPSQTVGLWKARQAADFIGRLVEAMSS
jgi:hypothetical protein